jgi:hypothetical protein
MYYRKRRPCGTSTSPTFNSTAKEIRRFIAGLRIS